MAKLPFTEQDKQRITEAVQKAEARTSGEIVPYYVEQSDDYEEAPWRAGGLSMAAALAVFFGFYQFTGPEFWLPFTLNEIVLITLGTGAVGMVLARFIPLLRRFFAGAGLVQRRTSARALEAFIEQEVFQTRDRSGVLIFMSMMEHRVHVIGDSGINAAVNPEDWKEVVSLVVHGMKSGKPADGLVHAIERVGELLEKRGVERRNDDANELGDGVVIGQ